jgi:hypothetical protein
MERIVTCLQALARALRRIGPLVLVEVLLPGGTLIALLLLLSRSGRLSSASRRVATFAARLPAQVRVVNAHAVMTLSTSNAIS